MFRKDPQIKALSNLKSSERRRMLVTITQEYGLPTSLTKECEELIVPGVVKQTTFISAKGFAGTIFTDEHQTPVWFKTKDSELIPSVYTLWKAPFILPIVKTHPHVIEVLEGGADLMLPGTAPPFPPGALEGNIVGVASTENPYLVLGVGRASIDMAGLQRVVGTKGVAVQMLHTNGDTLFQLAKQKIRPPETLELEPHFRPEEPEEPEESQTPEEPEVIVQEEEQSATTQPETEPTALENSQPITTEQEIDEGTESMAQLTTEDIDHFFERSVMQTLTSPLALEFPLPASTFMTHVVTNLATDHSSVQIKKTSWKKSTKFLKAMEKKGFIKLKGKADDITVVSAATASNNKELKDYVPYKVKKIKTSTPAKSSKANSTQLVLTKLYKPTSAVRKIFADVDMDFMAFYTTSEVKEIMNKYIAKHSLANQKNKKMILLDDALAPLIKGNEGSIGRDKIMDPFINKLSEHYHIFNPLDPDTEKMPPKRGQVPQVKIVTETKIGRKLITRVSNFEAFGIDAEQLSSELKVKCSGSSTIGQNVQNPKLVEVTVQGPHSKVVIELLTKKYGLNANWIEFEDKAKSKKKK